MASVISLVITQWEHSCRAQNSWLNAPLLFWSCLLQPTVITPHITVALGQTVIKVMTLNIKWKLFKWGIWLFCPDIASCFPGNCLLLTWETGSSHLPPKLGWAADILCPLLILLFIQQRKRIRCFFCTQGIMTLSSAPPPSCRRTVLTNMFTINRRNCPLKEWTDLSAAKCHHKYYFGFVISKWTLMSQYHPINCSRGKTMYGGFDSQMGTDNKQFWFWHFYHYIWRLKASLTWLTSKHPFNKGPGLFLLKWRFRVLVQ